MNLDDLEPTPSPLSARGRGGTPAVPEVYEHHKGGLYTALFTVADRIPEQFRRTSQVAVYVDPENGEAFAWPHGNGARLPERGILLLVAKNSTNPTSSFSSGAIVVYVSHLLWNICARDAREFHERVEWPSGVMEPRFRHHKAEG